MEEIWKDVQGYEGFYRVSSWGRVESLPREKGHRKESLIIASVQTTNGYIKASLSKGVRDRKLHSVHRLVAVAFISNPLQLPQVNHKDGDKTNNHVSNLEWVTQSQNMSHKISKEDRSRSLSKKVRQIDLQTLQEIRIWDSVIEAAKSLSIDNSSIGKAVKSGKPYKGYLWRYQDKLQGMQRPVIQEPEGKVWASQQEAHAAGYDPYLIRACAEGTRKEHKGSTWRWATLKDLERSDHP
jgi:hypothetical protein